MADNNCGDSERTFSSRTKKRRIHVAVQQELSKIQPCPVTTDQPQPCSINTGSLNYCFNVIPTGNPDPSVLNVCSETAPPDCVSILDNPNTLGSDNNDDSSLSSTPSHSSDDDGDIEVCLQPDLSTGALTSQLACWKVKNAISHKALNDLLGILKPHFPDLPTSSRTVMQTPRLVNITNCAGGHYLHLGVESSLRERISSGLTTTFVESSVIFQQLLQKIDPKFSRLLTLVMNVDGLPIVKSGNSCFWPIMIILDQGLVRKPFVVGIYWGQAKPDNVDDYLKEVLSEILKLESDGIVVDDVLYAVRIRCVVCDVPARNFLKNTVPYHAYWGCERCVQHGVWDRKVLFLEVDAPLRTHNNFLLNCNPNDGHVRGPSPFLQVSLDMVKQFPLDYMHLVALGVMRKFLFSWVLGKKPHKLHHTLVKQLDGNLELLTNAIPVEFSRKPRSTKNLRNWKATEFRLFVLYTGVQVLRGVLSPEMYKHFLQFHAAIYILSSDNATDEWVSMADGLLKEFVATIPVHYSRKFLHYNPHSLMHLADDVKLFGPLDSMSAFPFENFMSSIKRLLQTHYKELEQVAKRLTEMSKVDSEVVSCLSAANGSLKPRQMHDGGPTVAELYFNQSFTQYKVLETPQYTVKLNQRDSFFLGKEKNIFFVRNIILWNKSFFVICSEFAKKESVYKYPFDSALLDIFRVSRLKADLKLVSLNQLARKCVSLPAPDVDGSFFILPYVNAHCHFKI